MSSVTLPFSFSWLALRNALTSPCASRIPEPDLVTTAEDSVAQYRRGLDTKLAILNDVVFQLILQQQPRRGGQAIDLGCGPGLFAAALLDHAGYDSVTGVDLSSGMIEAAKEAARDQNIQDRATFEEGDITNLPHHETSSFDLVCNMGVMHHLPDLETVRRAFAEAERLVKPDGLAIIFDYVRYKSPQIIDSYAKLLGSELLDEDMPDLYADFGHSLHAAWTVDELRSTVPVEGKMNWFHLIPPLLPPFQIIVGTSGDLSSSTSATNDANGLPFQGKDKFPSDWRITSTLMKLTRARRIRKASAQE